MITFTDSILLAALGGLVAFSLSYVGLKNVPKDKRPDWPDYPYWSQIILNPLWGVILAVIYGVDGIQMSAMLAFQVGLSAPFILSSLSTAASPKIKLDEEG